MRTLVIAPSWVGDTVMALPSLEALAASGRRLVCLARPHLVPLLRLVPAVAETVERHPTAKETVERLRRAACEEAIILPNSFRSAWLPWRAGIPRRWGYSGQLRSPLLRPALRRPSVRGRHQTEDYAAMLAALEVPRPPGDWVPRLVLSARVSDSGGERLARAGLDPSTPLVGLFPGAEFGPSKRWPRARFEELSRELRRRRPDLRQVILAGPQEIWLAVRLHEETARLHPVVGPDLDLAGLAGVLSHLDLLVTNDSGPMHLAAALGVPCVALFGPTDPRRTAPSGPGHRILYTGRWCSPCFRRRCPLLHHRCLKDIGVEEVVRASLEGLDGDTG